MKNLNIFKSTAKANGNHIYIGYCEKKGIRYFLFGHPDDVDGMVIISKKDLVRAIRKFEKKDK